MFSDYFVLKKCIGLLETRGMLMCNYIFILVTQYVYIYIYIYIYIYKTQSHRKCILIQTFESTGNKGEFMTFRFTPAVFPIH